MSDVLERFLRYVQVSSQSDPANEAETPSTERQFDMARTVAADLEELGCEDVSVDEHAYVTASYPASAGAESLPALGLCAHMDTSPDAPGANVKPHIVRYEGGPLVAGIVDGQPVQTLPDEVPDLAGFVGQDIVVTDGTTLLGADDKAGVAEIVALIARLKENPELAHPTLKIAFVPDEEIGHGADLLDIESFGAEWCYTVDGGGLGEISYECFSAASAEVLFHGVQVHPGEAKDIMVNAISLAEQFDTMLPADERPEHTAGYEGYFFCMSFEGSCDTAKLSYIIRDFSDEGLEQRKELMRRAAAFIEARYGEGSVELKLRDQYRNMAHQFEGREFMIENAKAANLACGVEPRMEAIRGGTDGSNLTFKGLPCPNLATGGYTFHSVREFIPVQSMEKMVDVLEKLVALFAVEQKA